MKNRKVLTIIRDETLYHHYRPYGIRDGQNSKPIKEIKSQIAYQTSTI